jgi:hypothetical protein
MQQRMLGSICHLLLVALGLGWMMERAVAGWGTSCMCVTARKSMTLMRILMMIWISSAVFESSAVLIVDCL